MFSFALHTSQHQTYIHVEESNYSGNPYDIVRIGDATWFPSREQLVELQAKLNAHLAAKPSIDESDLPDFLRGVGRQEVIITEQGSEVVF